MPLAAEQVLHAVVAASFAFQQPQPEFDCSQPVAELPMLLLLQLLKLLLLLLLLLPDSVLPPPVAGVLLLLPLQLAQRLLLIPLMRLELHTADCAAVAQRAMVLAAAAHVCKWAWSPEAVMLLVAVAPFVAQSVAQRIGLLL